MSCASPPAAPPLPVRARPAPAPAWREQVRCTGMANAMGGGSTGPGVRGRAVRRRRFGAGRPAAMLLLAWPAGAALAGIAALGFPSGAGWPVRAVAAWDAAALALVGVPWW